MPTQSRDEPLSAYSSLVDVSSANDDDGIVFTAHHVNTPSPKQVTDAKGSKPSHGDLFEILSSLFLSLVNDNCVAVKLEN